MTISDGSKVQDPFNSQAHLPCINRFLSPAFSKDVDHESIASNSCSVGIKAMLSVTSPFLQHKWRRRIESPYQSRYSQHDYGGSQGCFDEVSGRKAVAVAGRTGEGAIILFVPMYGFLRILRTSFVVATGEGHC